MTDAEIKLLPRSEWTPQNIRDQFMACEWSISNAKAENDPEFVRFYKSILHDIELKMTPEQFSLAADDFDGLSESIYRSVLAKVKEQEKGKSNDLS